MLRQLILISGLVLIAAPATAAETLPASCDTATAQQEVNFCTAIKARAIDKELEAAYQAEADHLNEVYSGQPAEFKEELKILEDGQAAWRVYSRMQCTSEGYMARGGTLESQLFGECALRLTRLRIDELKTLAEGLGN